jgi:F-type H+-transporting ATPase subunit a
MTLIPSGLQNLVEAAIEAIHNLVKSVAGEERAPRFFPWVATFFIFLLIANWMSLIPGLAAIGVRVQEQGQEMIIPFLRPPSTDLNLTVGLAIVSVTVTQIYSVLALGPLAYISRYFNIRGLIRFFRGLRSQPRQGCMGIFFGFLIAFVDLFTGVLELVSEFAKIISFSFRLFGNLFGGELVLLVIGFLVPYLATVPFLAFEIIVGLMQAFVFAILTLIFLTMATLPHQAEEGH